MGAAVPKDSYKDTLEAILRKLNLRDLSAPAALSLVVLATIGIVAVFAPLLAPYDPNDQNLSARLELPSLAHPSRELTISVGTSCPVF